MKYFIKIDEIMKLPVITATIFGSLIVLCILLRKIIIVSIAALILVCPCSAYNRIKVEMANGGYIGADFNTREELNSFISENVPELFEIIKDVKPTDANDDDKTEVITLEDGFTTIIIWRDK